MSELRARRGYFVKQTAIAYLYSAANDWSQYWRYSTGGVYMMLKFFSYFTIVVCRLRDRAYYPLGVDGLRGGFVGVGARDKTLLEGGKVVGFEDNRVRRAPP